MEIKENKEQPKKGGLFACLKGRRRLPILVVGALLGVLLLMLGSVGSEKSEEESADVLAMRAAELAAYEEMLEKEIATLCDAVSGVSHVRVFVSFESGYVMKYTTDGEGVPITVGSGSKEQALYETVLPPRVSGVGITCAGGDRASVRQEITELISTALGISSNRVYIAGV